MELFPAGTIDISSGAQAASGPTLDAFLARHRQGDWGEEADDEDREWSDFGLRYGHAVTSIFRLDDGTPLFVVTSRDRSVTRVFLEHEWETREVSVREGYAIWAASYDYEQNPLIAIEEPHVERLIAGLPATRVLDVGTGTGRYALKFARGGAAVTAIDQSPEMLAVAEESARREGLRIDFQQMAIEEGLPFAAESFDFVVCALVLSHGPNLLGCVPDFARVVEPGGHVLITDFHPDVIGLGWRNLCTRPGATYLLPSAGDTRSHILQAVEAAGLTLREVIDVPLSEVPAASFPESVRHEQGDKPFCLIVLARKPAAAVVPELAREIERLRVEAGIGADESLADGKLAVVPISPPAYELDELLAGITEQNIHAEVDTGSSIGREVW